MRGAQVVPCVFEGFKDMGERLSMGQQRPRESLRIVGGIHGCGIVDTGILTGQVSEHIFVCPCDLCSRSNLNHLRMKGVSDDRYLHFFNLRTVYNRFIRRTGPDMEGRHDALGLCGVLLHFLLGVGRTIREDYRFSLGVPVRDHQANGPTTRGTHRMGQHGVCAFVRRDSELDHP
ncbi:MAG: hypothetical protein BWY82_01257 [Verrucomicrobia bacterium ADurb.Bin474]|nr:MAG: hypothetical protein BWY82_01257 [Verrucomicrobia bacterium ADurb.Bin474]